MNTPITRGVGGILTGEAKPASILFRPVLPQLCRSANCVVTGRTAHFLVGATGFGPATLIFPQSRGVHAVYGSPSSSTVSPGPSILSEVVHRHCCSKWAGLARRNGNLVHPGPLTPQACLTEGLAQIAVVGGAPSPAVSEAG